LATVSSPGRDSTRPGPDAILDYLQDAIEDDHIDRFTERGILTRSGNLREADIIVTATGFDLCVMGAIAFDLDGEPVDLARTFTCHGFMDSGLPNMASMFGYLRNSRTMRVDLLRDLVCRLINHMDASGATIVTPPCWKASGLCNAGPG
jgi:cation diffusion facilitator CzcD-associated flavoprotein CzcO